MVNSRSALHPLIVGLALANLAGCSAICHLFCSDSGGTPLPAAFEVVSGAPQGDAISRTVTIIADSHAHHLWGKPNLLQTEIGDRVSPSAIRTPQADLWGPYFQRWMLAFGLKKRPLVHLGDAADLACADEYEAFIAMMDGRPDAATFPWFQAPGNHDAYFYGNFHEKGGDWQAACAGSTPLTKDLLVRRYLSALVGQPYRDGGTSILAGQRLNVPTARFDDLGGGGLLSAVAWSTSISAPWKSFVVQMLDLTEPKQTLKKPRTVMAILLDTAVYDDPPTLVPVGKSLPVVAPIIGAINAGITGDITEAESEVVRSWAATGRAKGAVVVLMGHHPFSSLTARAQRLLGDLHAHDGAVLYVSAHDHFGQWKANLTDKSGWPELNIGSLLDEPVEGRFLQLSTLSDGRIAAKSELMRLDALLKQTDPRVPRCRPEWEAKSNEADYYLSYKQLKELDETGAQLTILNVLLSSWLRYFRFIHSASGTGPWPEGWTSDQDAERALATTRESSLVGDKVNLLQKIARDADQRPVVDPGMRDAFRICQGYWGSKYERMGTRLPDVDDWAVVIPKE